MAAGSAWRRGDGEIVRIGVLALQGSFAEHAEALRRLGAEPVLVRTRAEAEGIDGLIIPGGESTTIGRLMVLSGLKDLVRARILEGMPVYGTCAGMILLARDIGGAEGPHLGVMDIRVKRNAFGRQKESFEETLPIPALGGRDFRCIFIRAPVIEEARSGVRILAALADGRPIAAEQGKMLASAFHPELTDDLRMHRHFLDMIEARTA
jgi:pyridoxal 5'-phosphate synthase pdxT subunit